MQETNNAIAHILGTLHTTDQAEALISELDVLTQAVFKIGPENISHMLQTNVRSTTALLLQGLFAGQNISLTDTERLSSLLQQVKEEINACAILELTIAFEPTDETISLILSTLGQTDKKPLLLSIHVKPEIIAGCTITYQGKYRDYSLTDLFTKRMQEVVQTA